MEALKNKIGQTLPKGLLYHYTSIDGVMGILENSEVWATSILHLNDTKEYFEGAAIIDEVFKKKKRNSRKYKNFFMDVEQTIDFFTEKDVFVTSFSEHADQLSQWRGYTPQNSGYSIGFDFHRNKFSAGNTKWVGENGSFFLVKCIYDDTKKYEMAEALADQFKEQWLAEEKTDWKMGKKRIGQASVVFYKFFRTVLASACKNSSFKEEAEWRFVYISPSKEKFRFRKGLSSITPFIQIPLHTNSDDEPAHISEVVIGPTPDKQLTKSSLERFIETKTALSIPVRLSTIPFRSW